MALKLGFALIPVSQNGHSYIHRMERMIETLSPLDCCSLLPPWGPLGLGSPCKGHEMGRGRKPLGSSTRCPCFALLPWLGISGWETCKLVTSHIKGPVTPSSNQYAGFLRWLLIPSARTSVHSDARVGNQLCEDRGCQVSAESS